MLVYRSAGFYQEALGAYIEATAWQEALSVVYQVDASDESKVRDVASQLNGKKKRKRNCADLLHMWY